MAKRVTVSVTVEETWPAAHLRSIKDDMINSAMERIQIESLNVLSIEAKVGTVRKARA